MINNFLLYVIIILGIYTLLALDIVGIYLMFSTKQDLPNKHCVLRWQVTVKQTEQGGEKAKVKVGKLYMIDLAGSERAKQTQVI